MKVAITLDPNQTHEEAEEQLFKAMETHREGVPHDSGNFPDPAMEHQAQVMKTEYRLIYENMMREILEVFDEGEET